MSPRNLWWNFRNSKTSGCLIDILRPFHRIIITHTLLLIFELRKVGAIKYRKIQMFTSNHLFFCLPKQNRIMAPMPKSSLSAHLTPPKSFKYVHSFIQMRLCWQWMNLLDQKTNFWNVWQLIFNHLAQLSWIIPSSVHEISANFLSECLFNNVVCVTKVC